jgi:uncharacterized protein YndB with AHSA1/START domain
MSVRHASFTLERTYPANPARVFAAFADLEAKRKWFAGPPEWGPGKHEMDFRVGGEEISVGGPPGETVHTYRARFHDIVPDERIVTTYEMYMDDIRTSVSVCTIELTPVAGGTRLVMNEQGAFLDGHDTPGSREEGTNGLLDALGDSLSD